MVIPKRFEDRGGAFDTTIGESERLEYDKEEGGSLQFVGTLARRARGCAPSGERHEFRRTRWSAFQRDAQERRSSRHENGATWNYAQPVSGDNLVVDVDVA